MSVFASVLGKIGASLLASLLTEKVIMKLVLILVDKLVKSSKNKLDDELFATIKEAIDKEEKK